MSTLDIFYAAVVISFVLGILGLAFSYTDTSAISAVASAMNQTYNSLGLQPLPGFQQLSNNLYAFSFFFPEIAAIAVILLCIESLIMSFFIKAHPLAAVFAIFMLVVYTIASFFVSNISVQVARLAIFSNVVSGPATLLLIIWINMPVILVFFSVIDTAIALTASRQ